MTFEPSRRRFLGGAGALLALPFLESLVPAAARAQSASALPVRFLAYYVPNGIHMAGWTPATEGRDFQLTPILEPLAAVRDEVLVLSGLENRPARPDGPGDHASGTGSFLTARHPYKTEGADIRNGISLDQLAANALGEQTRYPSIQLGTEGGDSTGGCDSGYSCAYSRNISWASEQQPLAKLTNPRTVYDRMFAGFDPGVTAAELDRRRRRRTSVLDYVLSDVQGLRSRLGSEDQRKLDEYNTGIRELELRLEADPTQACVPGARPDRDQDFPSQVRLLSDLMVLAFQCDLTRIISFMFNNAASGRSFPFLGVPGAHHQISHHQGDPGNLSALQTIDTWEVEQLAYLLQRLASIPEGDGSLLDRTAVFFSSEIEDGDTHSHANLPVLLAGRAGGAFEPGRHLRFGEREPIAKLFVSILHALGVEADGFGDNGTGPLPGLG